jgi:meso-butanediol dehydrogenase / (S,S)-butanediol dehydrogenase / diacetyl reductase
LASASWDDTLAVNLTGVFQTARHTIPVMARARDGAFVAIASDAGLRGSAECAAYVASKHGVVGLVRALAVDYGPVGIRSNAICPGFVETPMLDRIFTEQRPAPRAARQAQVPLGRFAAPTEVAELAAFLLSERGAYINGEAIRLDGGAGA